jgi:MFS family permease
MSGANVMTYYVVYVFMMANLSGNINLISSGIQYALFIIFTTCVFFFIDKTGRRPLLIFGAIGMSICLFIVGGILGTYGEYIPGGVNQNENVLIKVTGSPSYVVIAFCYLLVIIYALTLAPVAWVYAAEVWSLETRATGMALAATANWLFNFALGMFTPPAFQTITWKTFIIFGVLCIGAAIQAFFTYPETCGKTLEEIELLFSKGGPHPWHTKPGGSRLDAEIQAVIERKAHGSENYAGGMAMHGDEEKVGSSQVESTTVTPNDTTIA